LKNVNLFWRTNNQIRAPELRVIGPEGKQLGVLKTIDALKKANELNLDLIEIAPNANPPVAKIFNFGKFRYSEEKKLRKLKKVSKSGELKEIRFSPFIAQHDYQTRIGRIKEFFNERSKVKIVVVFKGREMNSKKFGYQLIDKIKDNFEGKISIDMEPKFFGRHLVTIMSPVTKKIIKKDKTIENKDV
jgi:translation initiation factor IF-3